MQHNLAQFFDTILKSKFAMEGLALKASLGDISGGDATQNLKIAAHFSTKLAQFFDTILKMKFVMGGLASPEPPQNSTKCWTAQNLKIAAQFNTKLAQFFGTIFKSKLATGGWGDVPTFLYCRIIYYLIYHFMLKIMGKETQQQHPCKN